jgi:hypothetical protein
MCDPENFTVYKESGKYAFTTALESGLKRFRTSIAPVVVPMPEVWQPGIPHVCPLEPGPPVLFPCPLVAGPVLLLVRVIKVRAVKAVVSKTFFVIK